MSTTSTSSNIKQRTCSNVRCRTANSPLWRKGWPLNDGTKKHAMLCNACGLHYKKGHFCLWCNQIYKEADADDMTDPWIGCDRCSRWMHKRCEEENGYIFDQRLEGEGGEHISFLCPNCRDLKQQLIKENIDATERGQSSGNIHLPPKKMKKFLISETLSPASPSEVLNLPFSNVSVTTHVDSPTRNAPEKTESSFDSEQFVKDVNVKRRRRIPQERKRMVVQRKKRIPQMLPRIDTAQASDHGIVSNDRMSYSASAVQPRFDWDRQEYPRPFVPHYNYTFPHNTTNTTSENGCNNNNNNNSSSGSSNSSSSSSSSSSSTDNRGSADKDLNQLKVPHATSPYYHAHRSYNSYMSTYSPSYHQHYHYHPYFLPYRGSYSQKGHSKNEHWSTNQTVDNNDNAERMEKESAQEEQRIRRYQQRRHHSLGSIDDSMSKLKSLWAVVEMELKETKETQSNNQTR